MELIEILWCAVVALVGIAAISKLLRVPFLRALLAAFVAMFATACLWAIFALAFAL